MDAFRLRQRIVDDYGRYVRGFVAIKDEAIFSAVEHELEEGMLWPHPMLQLNPSFERTHYIEDLVKDGTLHGKCSQVFVGGKEKSQANPLHLFRHQVEAIHAAKRNEPYVLTTGTGSGKSLGYIVPIVDHVLRNGSGNGVQAIIVYPMNALANSQQEELRKFLDHGFTTPPVTFATYTGQQKEAERDEIMDNPPDIILTNPVMLELMLTRLREDRLIKAAQGIRFLVFDELHTYRGRQGSDVAMLIRRVKDALNAPDCLTIGTSATLASNESDDPRGEVAALASRMFGSEITETNVIQESLSRNTPELDDDAGRQLRKRLEDGYDGPLLEDPLSSWVESTIGLRKQVGTGRLVRALPRPLRGDDGLGKELAVFTGLDVDACEQALEDHFNRAVKAVQEGDDSARALSFRLHQFISRGGTPHVTLHPAGERKIMMGGQVRDPEQPDHLVYPLVFCRECGQEYLSIWNHGTQALPRFFLDRIPEGAEEPGYLLVGDWDDDDQDRLPIDWFNEAGNLKSNRREWIPQSVRATPDGTIGPGEPNAAVIRHPFRFCLNCKASYSFRNRSDYSKLASLDFEARATATTILTEAALLALRGEDLPDDARKLLSFTDNRQDASLQAGHFNDFVNVSIIRASLAAALTNDGELRSDEVAGSMIDALEMDIDDYALEKGLDFGPADDVRRTMKEVLAYRVFRDLQRGWRVTSPNLEQTGLLRFDYDYLDKICSKSDLWDHLHPALQDASPEQRAHVARALLDHMRHELCVKASILERETLERLQEQSQNRLEWQWAIDEQEKLSYSKYVLPRPRTKDDPRSGLVHVGPQSNFGLLLKDHILASDGARLSQDDAQQCIHDLLEALRRGGLVLSDKVRGIEESVYRIDASRLQWHAGDGTKGAVDVLRTPGIKEARTNPFFVEHFQRRDLAAGQLRAREHTAQVDADQRIQREVEFRTGHLPLLFCSPTMELGVDISELNVVNMRNVPPTPANYAQRSGRAGRGGQPAVVFTYCSRTSPHDQYFFRHPDQMVYGSVHPPTIDLQNEDLVRSHVYAVWLNEANVDLGNSMTGLVETHDLDEGYLQLLPSIEELVRNDTIKQRTQKRLQEVFDATPEILEATWYSPQWLPRQLDGVEEALQKSLARWRNLVRGARSQADRQGQRILRAMDRPERSEAERLQREANQQLRVLMNANADEYGDFYVYRYLAAEGFLPGYNFPRLPLSAFIPGRRGNKERYLNRPRFVAVSEFGPKSIIYHEGSKYQVIAAKQPPSESGQDGMDLNVAKICNACGQMHEVNDEMDPDVCTACMEAPLMVVPNMFRMQNVVTKRAEHISSDEEERRRLGFEIRTTVDFSKESRSARVLVDGGRWGEIAYASQGDLWRINLGERRRADPTQYGFLIEPESGNWGTRQRDPEDEEQPMNEPVPVVPFVHDNANMVVLRPDDPGDTSFMATLQAALAAAIQAEYHVEDRELASEVLPTMDERRAILFYEASAGGAGILRHLVDDRKAISRIAHRALEILHFDEAGEDLGVNSRGEACGGACYDCLLAYYNQRDHNLLNRHGVRDALLSLRNADFDTMGNKERLQHLCDTKLEKQWVELVVEEGYTLPTDAQHRHRDIGTRPDFCYHHDHSTAYIYVDGPHHDFDDIKRRDERINELVEKHGRRVVRFPWDEDENKRVEAWREVLEENSDIFGKATVRT